MYFYDLINYFFLFLIIIISFVKLQVLVEQNFESQKNLFVYHLFDFVIFHLINEIFCVPIIEFLFHLMIEFELGFLIVIEKVDFTL